MNEIDQVIATLRSRSGVYSLLREYLQVKEISPGQGWEDIVANSKAAGTMGSQLRLALKSFLDDVILGGLRYIQVHEVTGTVAESAIKRLSPGLVPTSDMAAVFPRLIFGKETSRLPTEPTLIHVRKLNARGDVAAVFGSRRYYEDRTSYQYSDVDEVSRKTFGDFEQLIAIQNVYFQAVDVLTIRPGLGRIEVSIDQGHLTQNPRAEIVAGGLLAAASLYVPELHDLHLMFEPVNLFPAIDGIYRASGEGAVISLGFRTLTRSQKRERMTAKEDLRTELFHANGAKAVSNQITPFLLKVGYELKFPSGYVEATLESNVRELGAETPFLPGFSVAKAVSDTDIVRVVNKVKKFVSAT